MNSHAQIQIAYEALCKGPQTQMDLVKAGMNPIKLTARMRDLRVRLQGRGMDWLNRNGTYELVRPV